MSLFKKFLSGADETLADVFGANMPSYCAIDTTDDEHTFITKNSGLLTYLDIRGTLRIMEGESLKEAIETLELRLNGVLAMRGFSLDLVIRKDPLMSSEAIKSQIDPLRKTAERLSLDVSDLLDEREALLSKKIIFEECTLVLQTYPHAIPADLLKDIQNEKVKSIQKYNIGTKPGKNSQSLFLSVDEIRESHDGFVNLCVKALGDFFEVKIMTAKDALKRVRFYAGREMTTSNWEASLPGDSMPARLEDNVNNKYDASHVLYPEISSQLFPISPEEVVESPSMIKCGETYTSVLVGKIKPDKALPFLKLSESIGDKIPWSVSYHMETGHDNIVSKVSSKKTLATIFAITNTGNLQIKKAAEELIERANEGEILASMQVTFSTWGSSEKETRRNKMILLKAIQGWGRMEVIDETGDPIAAWVNTLPGVSKNYVSVPFPMSVGECFKIMPFNRPTSPWSEGNLLFRTMDSKIYPMQSSSTKQTTWVSIVFALPGFGKSLYLSASNLSDILSARNQEIPLISIIDIGYSSSAFIEMIRDSLPKNKKHLVANYKLKMSKEFCINPFDTPLGSRFPISIHKEFLVNFLSLTLSPSSGGGISRLSELIAILVDEMYLYFSDDKNPTRYERGVDKDVDGKIDDYLINTDNDTTWFEVTDALSKEGLHHEAGLAQRYAMPTLNDATTVLSSSTLIKDVFAKKSGDTDGIFDLLNSMIVFAVKNYPIISMPTVFNTGSARIVSFDLADVAKSGSNEAKKQTGMMYMLSRQVMCKDYYMDSDTLGELNPKYIDYHRDAIERNMLQPKKICMDELHRCGIGKGDSGILKYVEDQIIVDIREGRKYDVQLVLLSQRVDDFSESMIDLASNVLIFSKGMTESTTNRIKELFSPSKDGVRAFDRDVTGPSKEGSTLLYLGQVKGKKARAEITLRLTLGPTELWGYSTTHEDRILKRHLSHAIGGSKARRMLARRFPAGTAKDFVINYLSNTSNEKSPYSSMCKKLINDSKNKLF